MLGTDNYMIKNNDINKIQSDFKQLSLDKINSIIPTEPEVDEENVVLKVGYIFYYRV